MNFLFVDRILSLNPGKEAIGLKHVTLNDIYLSVDQNNNQLLLPCIVGEALGQLCSWNVLKTSDFSFRPVGGVIQEIQMFADTAIGDTVLLESHIDTLDTDNLLVSFSGRASVNGKTLLTVTNSLAPLLPLAEFNHPEKVKADFANLYRPEQDDKQTLKKNPPMGAKAKPYQIAYDKILSCQPGQEIIAQKNVSLSAPYFIDHFPVKPVFPLSLLIEYNLQLAFSFLEKQTTSIERKNLRLLAVRKVKIGNFVLPGDSVITRLTLKKQEDSRLIVGFHNSVDDKKVCVAEAEFGLRSF